MDAEHNVPTMVDVLRQRVKDLEAERAAFITVLEWVGSVAYTYSGQKLTDATPQIREMLALFKQNAKPIARE